MKVSKIVFDMIFNSTLSLYKSGVISSEEVTKTAETLLKLSDPEKMKDYLMSIAERAVLEILQYLISNADRFDNAMGFLLSLQPGKYPIDLLDVENLAYRVYEAIDVVEKWLHHLNLLLKFLAKPEIRKLMTYQLPDGTRITVIHKPIPRIIIETSDSRKDITVNDSSWSNPMCPAMHVCVS